MSKVMLALLVFLLFISPLGLIDSPWCAMQNATTDHICDHGEQLEVILYGKLHICDCVIAVLPIVASWAIVATLILSFEAKTIMPQTAVMMPPIPPPRIS